MNLAGTLSSTIGGLINLSYLNLSFNKLTGDIPKALGNCSKLQSLVLNNNQFSGQIPAELGNLSLLEHLNICNNKISGSLPEEFGKLVSLVEFVAYTNNISGPLPQSIGKLKNLQTFRAGQNAISGSIPAEIGGCQSLELLGLAQNDIGGELPKEIGMLGSLTDLILWDNQLSGFTPKELGNCTSLQTLALYANTLVGPIPVELTNLKFLKKLYLYRNQLNGTVPRQIGNMSMVTEIDFSENYLTGEIPVELGQIKGLSLLYLFQNQLTGVIPNEISSLRNLTKLDLSINKLSGRIPSALGNLSHLTELQMGGNSLSGDIPPELGSLSSLQIAMNISYNNLTGEIPPEIGNLILLEFLLLNNNHLTGEIPRTLESLSSLLGCNFSYNDLSGPVPPVPIFQNMDLTSFIGNKGLCGGPLGYCGGDPTSSTVVPPLVNADRLRSKIITLVAAVVGGVSLILIVVILYFMRRPVETVPSLQDDDVSISESDIYFRPKEGFTFQDLVEATHHFHESYAVGRGACGTVYKAVMHSGQVIAVKKLSSNREGSNIENSFRAEILTLGNIRHRNIVKLYGFCYHQGSNLLLYEYMTKGSLGELLHGPSCDLDWPTRFTIALGAAEGLAYLHHDCRPSIIHRDIKSNNILLDDKFEAHVGDFGLAKVVDLPYSKSMSAVAGSYGYIAPGEPLFPLLHFCITDPLLHFPFLDLENLWPLLVSCLTPHPMTEYAYTLKVTEKCDIYSYGVVLLELLTGRTPVQPLEQGGDLVTWVKQYIRGHSLTSGVLDRRLDLEDQRIIDHMITVMKIALVCTSISPLDRPSMREVVLMLIESNEQQGNFIAVPENDLPPRHEDDDAP
ncbi:unnamed protein product [Linum tenue]|uniref:non-specific serine/threonine protein kinase n=1 Tax=Linum tenue TaxID=586396 RepID=A0AAV0LRD0_9ROSI|nr:unnamed protein product [Linum tenue]